MVRVKKYTYYVCRAAIATGFHSKWHFVENSFEKSLRCPHKIAQNTISVLDEAAARSGALKKVRFLYYPRALQFRRLHVYESGRVLRVHVRTGSGGCLLSGNVLEQPFHERAGWVVTVGSQCHKTVGHRRIITRAV